MKVQSLILYGSSKKLTNAHKLATVRGGQRIGRQPEYYVRTQVYNGDVTDALEWASPMKGEIVLNTAPVE